MDWLIVSLLSASVSSVIAILDKVILMKYAPSVATLIVLTGLLQIPPVLAILPFAPLESYSIGVWALGYGSGIIMGFGLSLMFWVLRRQDVSLVVPVTSSSPVFVAILAVVLLSERLTALHWIAILVTISGTVIVSMGRNDRNQPMVLGSPVVLLMICSILMAIGQIMNKAALDDMTFWNLFVVRSLGFCVVAVLLPLRPSVIRECRQVLRDRVAFGMIVLNEGGIAFGTMALMLWAISLGPVSLVATVMSTRPLFVFVLSLVLSSGVWRVLDEPLERNILTRKLVSTTMIVGGVASLSLL